MLTWEFAFALDPETLEPTTDPTASFLPPNDDPPEGEGAVYFSAEPVGSLTNGDAIDNDASIVFDANTPDRHQHVAEHDRRLRAHESGELGHPHGRDGRLRDRPGGGLVG